MASIEANKVDTGINKTLATNKVTWQDGRNMRFKHGKVYKTPGRIYLDQRQGTAALSGQPVHFIDFFEDYDGTIKGVIGQYDAMTLITASPSSYERVAQKTGLNSNWAIPWSLILNGGLPIVSNGVNLAQKYEAANTRFAALRDGNFNAPAFQTGVTHEDHILVGHITESGEEWAARMRWARAIQPESWSLTRAGYSGHRDLLNPRSGHNKHEIVKKVAHNGSRLLILCSDNIWTAGLHGTAFAFDIIVPGAGPAAARAVVPSSGPGKPLYYLGKDLRFYRMAGDGHEEIGRYELRDDMAANINLPYVNRSFAFRMHTTDEIWFCVPTGSAVDGRLPVLPDTAYVYNEALNCWTICDCNFTTHGVLPLSSGDGGNKADICGDYYGRLSIFDKDYNDLGQPIDGWIVGQDFCAESKEGPLDAFVKYVKKVFPKVSESRRNVLYISIGTKKRLEDEPAWSQPFEYKIGTSPSADFFERGHWWCVKFQAFQKNSPFALSGYGNEFEIGGTE